VGKNKELHNTVFYWSQQTPEKNLGQEGKEEKRER